MNSKLISYISLGVVGLLILTVILLAVIPVNTGVSFKEKPNSITVWKGDTQYSIGDDLGEDKKAELDKIWNTYNKAGSSSVMNAIFTGAIGKGNQAEYTDGLNYFSNLHDEDGEYCIKFWWKDEQTMVNADGSEFEYNNSTNIKFREAWVGLSTEGGLNKITVLLVTNSSSSYTKYVYTGYANTSEIVNVIKDFTFNVQQ